MKVLFQQWGLLVMGMVVGSFFIKFMFEITSGKGIFVLFITKYLAQLMG